MESPLSGHGRFAEAVSLSYVGPVEISGALSLLIFEHLVPLRSGRKQRKWNKSELAGFGWMARHWRGSGSNVIGRLRNAIR